MRGLCALLALLWLWPAVVTAQTAVVTNPPSVAGDCPTFTDTYGTVGDSGIYCSANVLKISKSGVPGLSLVPGYPGATDTELNVQPAAQVVISRQSVFGSGTSATDIDDVLFNRIADYTGGTSGFVNGAVRIDDTVHAGITAYEWALTCVLDNFATSTDNNENVCGYFQSKKESSGKTWALVAELRDLHADPVLTSVADEHDLNLIGSDAHANRVGLDLFANSLDGNPAVAAWGIRLNTDGHTTIGNGIRYNGSFGNGIDFTGGTFSGAAIILGDANHFCLDSLCGKYLAHNGSLLYDVGGSNVWTVSDAGAVGAASLSTTGAISSGANITLPTSANICLDGLTCANELSWNGAKLAYSHSGTQEWTVDASGNESAAGSISTFGSIAAGTTVAAGTNFLLPSGDKYCLDGSGCSHWLTYTAGSPNKTVFGNSTTAQTLTIDDSGNVAGAQSLSTFGTITAGGALSGASLNVGSGSIAGGALSGSSLTVGSGSLTAGAISSTSETSSGNIQGTNINATTSMSVPAGDYIYLNGSGGAYKLFESGGLVQIANGSTGLLSINGSSGVLGIGSGAAYAVGFSTGLTTTKTAGSCTFTITGGIITGVSGC